jgi:hypothetical protein
VTSAGHDVGRAAAACANTATTSANDTDANAAAD